MKKLFLILAFATVLCACSSDDDTSKVKSEMKKITEYLYEFETDDYGITPPAEIPIVVRSMPFGCSSVRNGNFFGRNLDFNINEICEFVVRTKASATRPHASIGVSNPVFVNVTNEMVNSGIDDKIRKFIPWMTMDGINDAGLVCNINVVNMNDFSSSEYHEHTNLGKPQYMVMYLIRAILDNCASVKEAISFINSIDVVPIPTALGGGWDGHLMIADANSTVIVEFLEGGIKVTEANIMTNFYNFMYEDNLKNGIAADKAFPSHGCGIERYDILKANYDKGGESMEEMWKLLKMVQYTQAYSLNTEPFWCSEYYDVIYDANGNIGNTSWSKEDILKQPMAQTEIEAYKVYKETGSYNPKNNLWFTSHNTTYNIKELEMWVTIREKYDYRYSFKL